MRYIIEGLLEDNIKKINNIKTLDEFYLKSSKVNLKSIQKSNILFDEEMILEFKRIIDIIISIIYKPAISSKNIDTIIPSFKAYELKEEDYRLTLQDSELWQKYNNNLLPREVHYHVSDDEIIIYENMFIVFLINEIFYTIKDYSKYYENIVDIYNFDLKRLNNSKVIKLFSMLDELNSKLKRVKHSRFYQVINKGISSKLDIKLTNIILNNSLYNECYKFYLKYFNKRNKSINKDFFIYNYFNLFKALNKMGYKLKSECKKNKILSKAIFYNPSFSIDIIPDINYDYIILDILNKKTNIKSHNILYLESTYKEFDIKDLFDSIYKIDTWKLKEYDNEFININNNFKSSYELMKLYLINKLGVIKVDSIYNEVCPRCHSRLLEHTYLMRTCLECGSKYTIFDYHNSLYLWFKKVRRGK